MRRPLARLSLTKSMLHPSLTVLAACSCTRSLDDRLAVLRLRTTRLAALQRRHTRLLVDAEELWAQQVVELHNPPALRIFQQAARFGQLFQLRVFAFLLIWHSNVFSFRMF